MAKPTTTRTLNPLPFDSLEPKRFEDLVRQLAYDFRPWRMLEATGRTGSDDGYDARGFEIAVAYDLPEPFQDGEEDKGEETLTTADDRLWLIQCKRERTIPPAKMRQHLAGIADSEAENLYGIIFAAACDFSKTTRDVVFQWARPHGISEVHIWGKGEIEDLLFQPKNDYLLFAYFGISLQIRKRSVRTSLRARLTAKRKVLRHLGDGWDGYKPVLLRDPEEERYPRVADGAKSLEGYGWRPATFTGNHADCFKVEWHNCYAYLSADGRHWDAANALIDNVHDLDHWLNEKECEKHRTLQHEVHELWMRGIAEHERARLTVECIIKYEDIIDIDEKGDPFAACPHVFVPFKKGRPPFVGLIVELTVPRLSREGEDGRYKTIAAERKLYHPPLNLRVEIFPAKFRRKVEPF